MRNTHTKTQNSDGKRQTNKDMIFIRNLTDHKWMHSAYLPSILSLNLFTSKCQMKKETLEIKSSCMETLCMCLHSAHYAPTVIPKKVSIAYQYIIIIDTPTWFSSYA